MCGLFFHQDRDLPETRASEALETIAHRGPDDSQIVRGPYGVLGFNRLAIMDLTHAGDQPFRGHGTVVACNGEIYNSDALRKEFKNYAFVSGSDCEVLLPLYLEYKIPEMLRKIDAEFALVIASEETGEVVAARDPIGIRPLFYGHDAHGNIAFASEAKALHAVCTEIKPFPPGHYYKDGVIAPYTDATAPSQTISGSEEVYTRGIRERLEAAVVKRLQSDAPMGFLLSGGLDSSLVCAIAQRHSDKPIRTFAIGMTSDAIDLGYARQVADYLGTDHTEVMMTPEEAIAAVPEVVHHLESFDITTVRASVGMFMLCKYIHEKTDVKVLLSGEVSDELFGYKYTDFCPSPEEFQLESQKRIRELYLYDVLRADRCISAHSIEARVPFSDKDFVDFVMGIRPADKMNKTGHGKYLLRKAFAEGGYLPEDILFREKAAFSDAVGHSLVDELKLHAESRFDESDDGPTYEHRPPISKESRFYRELFEERFAGRAALIPDFWMPNRAWEGCDVSDPSARVLSNYGKSGE